ncbi:MAG: hypothetical protein ACM31C_10880 [Acidobacteriota bacterium]
MLVVLVACAPSEHRAARERYNEGVKALAAGDFASAEKALIDARNQAGVDPELRFRAAYDLGLAYAAHADKTKAGEKADLSAALEQEQQAVSWFLDASRLHPDDADTKANLAIARARAAAIADQLGKGENKLEARLDALIGEQRGVLDEGRAAWSAIKQTGGADPLAQQATLTHLADKERGIIAEAGVVGDLAGEEIDAIGKKPEDKRSQQEKVRVVQLKNLDLYLLDGRTKIAEARRKLQDLAAEDGVARAEAALVALKRAREQLLDPITVLRQLAREQLELAQDTHAVGEHGKTGGLLGSGAPAKQELPAWLAPGPLGEREGGLRDRLEEIRARLNAGAGSEGKDDQQKKLIERVKAALPFVGTASDAMAHARDALAGDKVDDAEAAERDALIALARAIEQFADLKQTIDLAAATQHELVTLLSPEAAKQLPAAERASETKDALAQNLARMPRIGELLADETKQLDAQQPPKDPKQAEAAQQHLEQAKAQLAQAESLRGDAAKALGELDAALKANKDPVAPAKQAEAKLDELRKLFFSVIEHLQELIREQGETRDQTAAIDGQDDFTRAPKLPGLVQSEGEHAQMAKAITDALAKQADEASKQPPPGQGQPPQQGQIPPKTLAAAADEVRLAQGEMTTAGGTLGKAQTDKTQSFSLKPAIDSEAKAIEHLENALKLLQPPKQDNKDQKDQNKQQQQQQQQDQKQQQDQQPQPQGGAGQRARDEDARRQRERAKQHAGTDPVDQDW